MRGRVKKKKRLKLKTTYYDTMRKFMIENTLKRKDIRLLCGSTTRSTFTEHELKGYIFFIHLDNDIYIEIQFHNGSDKRTHINDS